MVKSLLIMSFSELNRDARVLRQIDHFSGKYRVTTLGFGPAPTKAARHLEIPVPRMGVPRRLRAYAEAILLRARLFRIMYATDPMVRSARKALRGQHFDRILANDVNVVPLAFEIADPASVHADLHEYYPGLHDDSPAWVRLRQPYLTWLVRAWVPRAGSVTTVSSGLAKAYRHLGVHADVVTNAPIRQSFAPMVVRKPVRLVHAGAALPGRRIEQMMEAAATSTADVTLSVFLTPNNPDYVERLKAAAEAIGPRVQVLPPIPHTELLSTLNTFDIGIHVLPPTVTNQALALPNKLFDFVQARLGVIVGPTPAMAEIVEAHRFGAVTSGFEVADIREAIDKISVEQTRAWKEAADAASSELSAASQIPVWNAAIDALQDNRRVRDQRR